MIGEENRGLKKVLESINNKLVFPVAFLLCYILILLSKVLIPLVLAIFIGLLMESPIKFLKKYRIPLWLSFFILLVFMTVFMLLFTNMLTQTINEIVSQRKVLAGQLEGKLTGVLDVLKLFLGNKFNLHKLFSGDFSYINTSWIVKASAYIFLLLEEIGERVLLCSVFLLFLIKPIVDYDSYLIYLSKNKKQGLRMINHYVVLKNTVLTYMKVKLFASLSNAIIFMILCLSFGVDFPFFWFMMTFILYFIPNIGPIIITFSILLLGFIQIHSIGSFIFLAVLLSLSQFIIDNVIEPKFLGNVFSMSPVTVLVGLIFWAYLWGVMGMFLAIPLLVLIREVLVINKSFGFIVRLMEGKDNVHNQ